MNKTSLVLCFLLALPALVFAQSDLIRENWHKNWRLGTLGGFDYLAAEIKKDFSKAEMEVNSAPRGAFSFYLDKRFPHNFEAGIEFEKNYFSAQKTYPNHINWLMYSDRFNNASSKFIPAPIYSKSNTSTWFINLIYNFPNFHSTDKTLRNCNPYVKGGIGFSSIGVETGYIDPSNYEKSGLIDPIYEKGQGIHSFKDMYGALHMGGGVNYYLSLRFSVSCELLFLFITNDYIDGIQNFELTTLPNNSVFLNRMGVFGTITDFKVGISYHFNWFKQIISNGLWNLKYEEFTNKFYHDKNEPKPENKAEHKKGVPQQLKKGPKAETDSEAEQEINGTPQNEIMEDNDSLDEVQPEPTIQPSKEVKGTPQHDEPKGR